MGKEQAFIVAQRHAPGTGQVQYITVNDEVLALTYGSDGRIVQLDSSLAEKAVLQVAGKGPHSFVYNPMTLQAAVVTNERWVKVVQFPGFSMDELTSLSLPIRAMACSPDGKHLCMAGDEQGARMCKFIDGQSMRKLLADEASSYYYYGLAWDPAGQFLAGAQMDGTLCVWDLKDTGANKRKAQKYKMLRKVDRTQYQHRCGMSWSPDGGAVLAVPGNDNDVLLIERDYLTGAERERRGEYLAGGHAAPAVCCSYSPNGIYVASGDENGVVCIWDAARRTIVARAKAASSPAGGDDAPTTASTATGAARAVISLSWHPTGNNLLVMNANGEVCSWSTCVPVQLAGPAVPLDVLDKMDIADMPPANAAANQPTDRLPDEEDEEEVEESLNDFIVQDRGADRLGGRMGGYFGEPRSAGPRELPRQKPFQPCSTPSNGSAPHFLHYTRLGSLISRPVDDRHSVEVTLHDTQRLAAMGGRVAPITDYFRYTHGCLGERGVLLGSLPQRDMASMVTYRPFMSQPFDRSEWQVGLPEGEAVVCLAAGASFAAVATSAGLLRLLTPAGLQLAILTLPGPAVTMAAQGHSLAVVTIAGAPSEATKAQNLWLTVYDAETTSCTLSCPCPLTPGSHTSHKKDKTNKSAKSAVTSLTWLGFNDRGAVAVGDSAGMVQVRSPMWGGCWIPVHREADHVKAGEHYWPVAIQGGEILTIMIAPPNEHPQVSPAPFLTALALKQPTVNARDEQLENDRLMAQLMLAQAHSSYQAAGSGNTVLASAMAAAERFADVQSLKVVNAALKGGRAAVAHDAAACLVQISALEGALRLANHHRSTVLAEKISTMIQVRREEEELAQLAAQQADHMSYHAGLATATMTPIPMKAASTGDNAAQGEGAAAEGAEPGSAGPPSTGGGMLTALKAAAQASNTPVATAQANGDNGQKRKAGPAAPLNNPFARRPAKQSKA